MIWLFLWNFIATLASIGIIWRGFCETNSSDLIFGIILLIVNLSYLVFNLTRKLFDK
jgi:hypothetical protein